MYTFVHVALDKLSQLLKSMLTQVGSQRNKLRDTAISLQSLKPALKSLEWDAIDLTLMNNDQLAAISEDTCLAMHEQETAEGLDAIKGCVEEVKDTLNRIEGFENPCGMGWTRVVKVDYTDPLVPCPGVSQKNVYASPGCSRDLSEFRTIITYSTGGQMYNEVCGRISALSSGIPTAFLDSAGIQNTIDSVYVDGVSLTHDSPRTHIWTFAAAAVENPMGNPADLPQQCPCDGGTPAPNFVRGDYFCEAGVGAVDISMASGFHADDILWDGEDCTTELCCTLNTPPYFYSSLDTPTTDDIDARLMQTSFTPGDDIVLTTVELYIRYTEPPE